MIEDKVEESIAKKEFQKQRGEKLYEVVKRALPFLWGIEIRADENAYRLNVSNLFLDCIIVHPILDKGEITGITIPCRYKVSYKMAKKLAKKFDEKYPGQFKVKIVDEK